MIIAYIASVCLLALLPMLHPAKAVWPHLNMSLIGEMVIPSPAKSLVNSINLYYLYLFNHPHPTQGTPRNSTGSKHQTPSDILTNISLFHLLYYLV